MTQLTGNVLLRHYKGMLDKQLVGYICSQHPSIGVAQLTAKQRELLWMD